MSASSRRPGVAGQVKAKVDLPEAGLLEQDPADHLLEAVPVERLLRAVLLQAAEQVVECIGQPRKFILAIAATTLAFTLAVILGTAAAYAKSRIVDRLVTLISLVGVSVPHFWLAIVLVIIFAVELGALPPMGMGPENSTGWRFDRAHLAHMVLPTIALSVIPLGVVTRTVRSTIKETLSMEFVTALQAKGMSDSQILRHVLKNAAPTCLAVMGLQAGNLIGGSILIETVFAWPGTGFLLNSAIFRRDLPILQGTTLVLAFFFMMLNLTVDVIQTLVDPRIKRG